MACAGTFLAKVEQVSSYYLSHVTNLLQQIFASHNKLCVAPQEKYQEAELLLVKSQQKYSFKKVIVIASNDSLFLLLLTVCSLLINTSIGSNCLTD